MEIYNIESVLFLMQGLIGVRECKMIDDYKLSTWKKKKLQYQTGLGMILVLIKEGVAQLLLHYTIIY